MTRTCEACREPKPPGEFYPIGKGRLHPWCRACCADRVSKHRGLDRDDDAEVRERVVLVRAAKRAKHRRGGVCDLNDRELDRVLPPIECARTRDRLAKGG